MNGMQERNSEIFLKRYRILEDMLEKRYEGEKTSSSSVVMEYIRDDDSQPVRVDLDLMREIRNILTHNAGPNGESVAEPSDEILSRLNAVIEYVKRPRFAADFGTPAEDVLSAHPNDNILSVMRNMRKNGFSHMPVREKGRVTGVFSVNSLFEYLADHGLESLGRNARIAELGDSVRLERQSSGRSMFVAADTSIVAVRNAFRRCGGKNSRLSVVFVTQNGSPDEELISMITAWDVLGE